MIRVVLEYLLPLVLPAAVYVAWVWYARRRHDGEGEAPGLNRRIMFWCLLAGFVLMSAGLVTLALRSGDPPDAGKYQAPRLEGGKVVPPRYNKE